MCVRKYSSADYIASVKIVQLHNNFYKYSFWNGELCPHSNLREYIFGFSMFSFFKQCFNFPVLNYYFFYHGKKKSNWIYCVVQMSRWKQIKNDIKYLYFGGTFGGIILCVLGYRRILFSFVNLKFFILLNFIGSKLWYFDNEIFHLNLY